MKRIVKGYLSTCEICQKRLRVTVRDKVPITPVQRLQSAFEHVQIDVIGPIARKSTRGHAYILVLIDSFSRYPIATPLKTLTAKEVCDRLMEIFCTFSIPTRVGMDNGTNFVSSLNQEFCKRLGVEMFRIVPRNSRANGLVERTNQTIENMLNHVLNSPKPGDWDLSLQFLCFALRSVPNETLGVSPFQLVFGRVPHSALHVLRDSWVGGEQTEPEGLTKPVAAYLTLLRDRLKAAADVAEASCSANQTRTTDAYNAKCRQIDFDVGDIVLILRPDSTDKFSARWMGPGTVTAKVSDNGYYVSLEDGSVRHIHANMIRKFNPRVASIGVVFEDEEEFGDIGFEPEVNPADIVQASPSGDRFDAVNLEHLSRDRQVELRALLRRFDHIFDDRPGLCNLPSAVHHIPLVDGFKPKRLKAYRVPDRLREGVGKQIDLLLAEGKIRPSHSEFAHPIVCVAKKGNPDDVRICCDFRYINSGTINDAFPLPDMEALLRKVSASSFITCLDASSGYNQIKMAPEDIYKTGFVCFKGFFEFLVLPFGLKCSGSTFVRVMAEVLKDHSEYAGPFVDDTAVHSLWWRDHLTHLENVFCAYEGVGMTLKLSKCKFAMPRVDFLGHNVGSGSLSV